MTYHLTDYLIEEIIDYCNLEDKLELLELYPNILNITLLNNYKNLYKIYQTENSKQLKISPYKLKQNCKEILEYYKKYNSNEVYIYMNLALKNCEKKYNEFLYIIKNTWKEHYIDNNKFYINMDTDGSFLTTILMYLYH